MPILCLVCVEISLLLLFSLFLFQYNVQNIDFWQSQFCILVCIEIVVDFCYWQLFTALVPAVVNLSNTSVSGLFFSFHSSIVVNIFLLHFKFCILFYKIIHSFHSTLFYSRTCTFQTSRWCQGVYKVTPKCTIKGYKAPRMKASRITANSLHELGPDASPLWVLLFLHKTFIILEGSCCISHKNILF